MFLQKNAGDGQRVRAEDQSLAALDDFIPQSNECKTFRSTQFQVPARRLVHFRKERSELDNGLLELLQVPKNFFHRANLILDLSSGVKGTEMLFSSRNRFGTEKNRLGLFNREREVTVFLEQFLGAVPPFFEVRFFENGGNEDFGQLVLSHPVIVIREDLFGEFDGIGESAGADSLNIFRNSSADMVGGQRSKRLGSVLHLHLVSLFFSEINHHFVQ